MWKPEALGGGFERVPDLGEVGCEFGFGEGDIIDADTLADEAEVRGGVEADFAAGVLGED